MKLLFDANISPKLAHRLKNLYPDSEHVRNLSMMKTSDDKIWNHAKQENYTIVTKDADFNDYSIILGFPPKIIWIRKGNCSTKMIERILTNNFQKINDFENDTESSCMILI
jgi:predicted nuclease of predicted toxin-antitoxin system